MRKGADDQRVVSNNTLVVQLLASTVAVVLITLSSHVLLPQPLAIAVSCGVFGGQFCVYHIWMVLSAAAWGANFLRHVNLFGFAFLTSLLAARLSLLTGEGVLRASLFLVGMLASSSILAALIPRAMGVRCVHKLAQQRSGTNGVQFTVADMIVMTAMAGGLTAFTAFFAEGDIDYGWGLLIFERSILLGGPPFCCIVLAIFLSAMQKQWTELRVAIVMSVLCGWGIFGLMSVAFAPRPIWVGWIGVSAGALSAVAITLSLQYLGWRLLFPTAR